MPENKVYSGIRATGQLHLGNYFGAVKGMLALQDKYDCVFSIVDLHTITTPYDPQNLQNSILEIALDYLAAGLDPNKSHLEVQSLVPEHTELAYLLGTIYPVSRLQQLPTYKDKVKQHPKYQNMGLLFYPILMAADILLYKANLVPVGDDQEPHLEVTREIARNFNRMFSDTFPETQRFATEGAYIPSLLGEGKMSKSVEGSYINLADEPDVIMEKVSKAVTDSGPLKKRNPLPTEGPIHNLFTLLKMFDKDAAQEYEAKYKNGTIKYSQLKKSLAEAMIEGLAPIQAKRKNYADDKEQVWAVLRNSSAKLRPQAQATLIEVKQKMGLL